MTRFARSLLIAVTLTALAGPAHAQAVRGRVVDQTGLALPGATIQIHAGAAIFATTTSGPDGTFLIETIPSGASIVVSLDGFETVTVPPGEAATIVLPLAHATETMTVVATAAPADAAPTVAALGSSITAETVARLPSSHMKARESLPLLPSIVRGPDGLLQLGGARPSDTPLLIDGFNVTNPATGISSINLPFEAVKAIDVLRDPTSVAYGDLVGGLIQIRTTTGGDKFKFGVQGVVPRPRFTNPGFGRLEGIFPRVYGGGAKLAGQLRYFAAAEYDYERIPVPDVTQATGPDVVETSGSLFLRVDARASDTHGLTFEALQYPASSRSHGLGPRREQRATTDNRATDRFAGIIERAVLDDRTVLTVQAGVLSHDTTARPNGSGTSYLTPSGWRGNWFANVDRTASRYSAKAVWEHLSTLRGRSHDVSLAGEIAARRLSGSVEEGPIVVLDVDGRVTRRVEFGPASAVHARDVPFGAAVRDVWQASSRATIDMGVRYDGGSGHAPATPSARAGLRYALDNEAVTVVKAGLGMFVATVPLAAEAYENYPTRIETDIDPATGEATGSLVFNPAFDAIRLPRATTLTLSIERQLTPRLDAQLAFTRRETTHIATLRVPADGGLMPVRSDGSSTYRDLELSVRRRWDGDQQIFVSYVRAAGRGEFNDFSTLFQSLAVPVLQRAGVTRTPTDARDRLIAWGTVNLPLRIVVSPVTEWRSGFPYTVVDQRYVAVEANKRSFPPFMATDLIVYKTFTVKKRSADIGFQLFNATNHFNPRDVYAVLGAPEWGRFANSVGPILRGFLMLKWK